jgi:hypothetical protein
MTPLEELMEALSDIKTPLTDAEKAILKKAMEEDK